MISVTDVDRTVTEAAVLRRWVRRETRKAEYSDADPADWESERPVEALESSHEGPAEAAVHGEPTWLAVSVDGTELGAFDVFPGCGWDTLRTDAGDEFPKAAENVRASARRTRTAASVRSSRASTATTGRPVLLEGATAQPGTLGVAREDVRRTHRPPRL